MKNGFILLSTVFIVIAASGCVSQDSSEASAKYLVYSNQDYGVEMKYPYGWDVNEEAEGIVVAFVSPTESADDRFRESVNLVMNDLSGQDMDLETYSSLAVQHIADTLQNMELEESASTTLDGNPAMGVIYTADGTYGRLRFLQVWTIKDDISYILTYTSESEKSALYSSTVGDMMDSFRINPIHSVTQETPNLGATDTITKTTASTDNVVGRWRAYSEAIYYDSGGNNYLDTASTRLLYINADGSWEFGSSGGRWETKNIEDSDCAKWDTNSYGPARKIVLNGWNDGVGDGPIEEGAARVDFIWLIYRTEASLGPGQVQIKFGHTSG